MQVYKKIALIGAIANPNIGDESILRANLQIIKKMYGTNCKVYIFTKDASYTSQYSSQVGLHMIPIDYLHRITIQSGYDIHLMQKEFDALLESSTIENNRNSMHKSILQIFEDIDILHIIGGGYLNSIWPDMMYEVVVAAQLAQKYCKKYIITGISAYPLKEKESILFNELCRGATFVDFRDDTLNVAHLDNVLNMQVSTDDALLLEDMYLNTSLVKYANVLFHEWGDEYVINLLKAKLEKEILPFMYHILDLKIVDLFNILGFSENDIALWDELKPTIPVEYIEKICFKNLIAEQDIWAKHIISNAVFNIGSRYHMAVFALSASTPVYSMYVDEYYRNKIKSIHKLYESEEYINVEDITQDKLMDFLMRLEDIRNHLSQQQERVKNLYQIKCQKIAEAYAINKVDVIHLYKKITGDNYRPKISVIIPVYNMDAYISECLNSVINQSLKELEIICIDDGSVDYTQTILNEYAWKDKRIKVITQTNHGVAYTRNVGIEMAIGEFLFFLDPDDWLPDSDTFLDMYQAAIRNNALICGGSFREYSTHCINDNWTGNLCKYSFDTEGFVKYSDYQFDYGWVRFIYNREFIVYNKLRIPSLTFFEDPVFFVKVMHQAQKFYALTRCTYCYRTGYKSPDLPYLKVLDLMKGLHENIRFAKENDYYDLISLELARIENDYAQHIVKFLIMDDSVELRTIINKINAMIFENNNRLEYRIYNKLIGTNGTISWRQNSDLQRQVSEIYASTTWKLGNFILFIPKKLKNFIRRR